MSESDIFEMFIERAAIIEFEGGLSRLQATYNAARDIRRIYKIDRLPEAIFKECERVKNYGRRLDQDAN